MPYFRLKPKSLLKQSVLMLFFAPFDGELFLFLPKLDHHRSRWLLLDHKVHNSFGCFPITETRNLSVNFNNLYLVYESLESGQRSQ